MEAATQLQAGVRTPASSPPDFFVGGSRWARRMQTAIRSHSLHDRAVLISGESGTGKEFVARLVHENSARKGGPFHIVNCRALSTESLEAALFGEIRRKANNAHRVVHGAVEKAKGGVLYLKDFVPGDNSVSNQISQLLFTESYHLIGSEMREKADVRLIFGMTTPTAGDGETKSNPQTQAIAVADRIELLPLRERREDILPLALRFLASYFERTQLHPQRFSSEAEQLLLSYHWPENVAELKQVVELAALRAIPAEIPYEALSKEVRMNNKSAEALRFGRPLDLNEHLEKTEREVLCAALRAVHGRQNKAAALLRISKSTLNNKLARFGIDTKDFGF